MRFNPYYALAGVVGIIFVVWLFSSMARTEFANRVLFTLLICIVLVGLAGGLAMLGRRRGSGDRER